MQPPQLIKDWIREQALDLGFADCGFVTVNHPLFVQQIQHLKEWLNKGYEGQLAFMHEHHDLRANPSKLVEGTKTIISVRMDYLVTAPTPRTVADNQKPNHAIIARYARGRDYHKVMRGRLKQLGKRIAKQLPHWYPEGEQTDAFVFRPFSDSAPIFERAIADAAGLGWTGKHTLLINQQAGSFFVLGELFISIDLFEADQPLQQEVSNPTQMPRCGSCTACIDVCPTKAIVAPYQINASACISYLTIEHDGSIPIQYRKAIGNRVFGCDDCQLICPWNRYANLATIADFNPRHGLDDISLLALWQWTAEEFEQKTQGSPLRRTGYVNFLRNIAIALGNTLNDSSISDIDNKMNSTTTHDVIGLLNSKLGQHEILDEHIYWAIAELNNKNR